MRPESTLFAETASSMRARPHTVSGTRGARARSKAQFSLDGPTTQGANSDMHRRRLKMSPPFKSKEQTTGELLTRVGDKLQKKSKAYFKAHKMLSLHGGRDTCKKGLSLESFRSAFTPECLNLTMTPKEMKQIIQICDPEETGRISTSGFLTKMLSASDQSGSTVGREKTVAALEMRLRIEEHATTKRLRDFAQYRADINEAAARNDPSQRPAYKPRPQSARNTGSLIDLCGASFVDSPAAASGPWTRTDAFARDRDERARTALGRMRRINRSRRGARNERFAVQSVLAEQGMVRQVLREPALLLSSASSSSSSSSPPFLCSPPALASLSLALSLSLSLSRLLSLQTRISQELRQQAMMKQSVAFLNGIADIDALYQKREARDGKGAARGPWATRNRVGAGMGSWTQHT
tara:strand:- start:335 stop:1561 length:1227 start_codon:yes stop_codon:yes gene_type:complete